MAGVNQMEKIVSLITCVTTLCQYVSELVFGVDVQKANVKQTQKMVPLITCEISLGQHVCELMFGINVSDLNFGTEVNSVKQPVKSNSVGSGNMSHCRASSHYDHF